uniref:GOLD domain-containing protein n=1 Tax=Arcella intermedia TaxID=1963864 RepID=A0A6B2LI96_9EUKA
MLGLLGVYLEVAHGISFDVPPGDRRCIKEELLEGQIIHGHYSAELPQGVMKMTFQVRGPMVDSTQEVIIEKNDVGREQRAFALTVYEDGIYDICVLDRQRAPGAVAKRVTLEYDEEIVEERPDLLSVEDLSPVDNMMKKTVAVVERLEAEFLQFREREALHRNTNESTNARIPTLSIITIIMLVACGAWQILYLKNFFMKKKLI